MENNHHLCSPEIVAIAYPQQQPPEYSGLWVKDVQPYSWAAFLETALAPSYVSDSPSQDPAPLGDINPALPGLLVKLHPAHHS